MQNKIGLKAKRITIFLMKIKIKINMINYKSVQLRKNFKEIQILKFNLKIKLGKNMYRKLNLYNRFNRVKKIYSISKKYGAFWEKHGKKLSKLN